MGATPCRNWTVEIISPYFARDPENDLHKQLAGYGAKSIHLLLPTNQDGDALVQPAYYERIAAAACIQWAEWHPDLRSSLGLTGQIHRRLHAKLYHFYNGKQSWVFVGSVNFSRQAMYKNIEAGMLVKLDRQTRLLKPLEHDLECAKDTEKTLDPEVAKNVPPPVFLDYDWKQDVLCGTVQNMLPARIQVLDAESAPILDSWEISKKRSKYSGSTERLQNLLTTGSLVRVQLKANGKSWPAHRVLLQQTGWSHKPIRSLPDLSPAQILEIYSTLSQEQRQMLLMSVAERRLVRLCEAGEMTLDDDADHREGFLSEFAELFHAFRQLEALLTTALENKNYQQVDYYLTGSGVDSLPSLTRGALTAGATNPTFAYLVLLCTRSLLRGRRFTRRSRVAGQIVEIEANLSDLRTRLQFENTTRERRARFFKWYEAQFAERQHRTSS